MGFPDGSVVKNPPVKAEDVDLIPESGRSLREGNGNPLQCSCLENPRDGGACRAAVYGVAQSRHDWSDLAAAAAAAAVKVMGLGCRFITPGALHSIGVWEAILPPGNPFDSQWPISLCLASGVLLCLVSEWSSLSRVWLSLTPWPARLLCPWDSPGKNTGVGCHFLLQW